MFSGCHVCIIVPAHNEQLSIGLVLEDLASLDADDGSSLIDDVVVCNNASNDATREIAAGIARRQGWAVVNEDNPGYGAACQAALKEALIRVRRLGVRPSDTIVVFVDGDRSVDVSDIYTLLKSVVGADLVIGCRSASLREPGALTLPQRAGNRFAAMLIRALWGVQLSDLGPLRAIWLDSLQNLNMRDQRFGWTIEMQIRAIQKQMIWVEVPVAVRRRIGKSKISGTVRGVCLAGYDIISTLFMLKRSERDKQSDVAASDNPEKMEKH